MKRSEGGEGVVGAGPSVLVAEVRIPRSEKCVDLAFSARFSLRSAQRYPAVLGETAAFPRDSKAYV